MQYKIASGDTLTAIAQRIGCPLEQILTLNPKLRAHPDSLAIGQTIELPAPAPHNLAPPPTGWVLGSLSEKYETGGRNSVTVSSGTGDAGGVSYGSYQMTSAGGGTVTIFVRQPEFPWLDAFTGLTAGTAEFTAKWIELTESAPEAFKKAEHDFIKRTHFDPLCRAVFAVEKIDILGYTPAIQDVIWSTAVQHGAGTNVVHLAFETLRQTGHFNPTSQLFEQDAISAIYAERGRKDSDGILVHFARNSPTVQSGVTRRFQSELAEALRLLEHFSARGDQAPTLS